MKKLRWITSEICRENGGDCASYDMKEIKKGDTTPPLYDGCMCVMEEEEAVIDANNY